MTTAYETVIGLEVHVQLLTRTKIFCGCPTTFGAPPNSQTCPVCLGLPGSLPVLNRRVLELGLRTALALHCAISPRIKFDRKNYFYPDLPKGYQISQYDQPLSHSGWLEVRLPDGAKRVGITRAHLEEDAGKLMHEGVKDGSLVDFNRAGTPLLEIVSEPDMRSPDEAYAYLGELKAILQYLEVSDCNMEEGSLRCDVNLSVRPAGQTELGTKVEIKNLNSFKAVRSALLFEVERQREVVSRGEKLAQETRLWNADREVTISMRSKEAASDYRYFPEPDLVPFAVDSHTITQVKEALPELPRARADRFIERYQLPAYDAHVLTAEKALANFFEAAVAAGAPAKAAANWLMGDIMSYLNTHHAAIAETKLTAQGLARLVAVVEAGTVSRPAAKEVLAELLSAGGAPEAIIAAKGLRQVSDASQLDGIITQVIMTNAKSVADFRAGKANALMFLVGQCMKASKGQANPQMAAELLRARLT